MTLGALVGFGSAMALLAPAVQAMPDPAPRGAQYVSLGDSYVAAGSLTTSTAAGCSQAADNVGHLISARLRPVSFGDWACSGADTDDFTTVTAMGPQLRGLTGDTEFVTISIGGNDEDLFGTLLANCLASTNCTPAVHRAANAKVDRLGPALDRVYAQVKHRAPKAQVVVIGYPRLLPDDVRGCFAEIYPGPGAVAVANDVQRRLNEQIAESADRAGFTAVFPDAAARHTMCAPDGQRYVALTGIGPGDAGTPVHPTLLGRREIAKLAAAQFSR